MLPNMLPIVVSSLSSFAILYVSPSMDCASVRIPFILMNSVFSSSFCMHSQFQSSIMVQKWFYWIGMGCGYLLGHCLSSWVAQQDFPMWMLLLEGSGVSNFLVFLDWDFDSEEESAAAFERVYWSAACALVAWGFVRELIGCCYGMKRAGKACIAGRDTEE